MSGSSLLSCLSCGDLILFADSWTSPSVSQRHFQLKSAFPGAFPENFLHFVLGEVNKIGFGYAEKKEIPLLNFLRSKEKSEQERQKLFVNSSV